MIPLSQHPRVKAFRAKRAALRALTAPGHTATDGFTSTPLLQAYLQAYSARAIPSIGRKSLTARVVEALTSGKAERKAIAEARAQFHARLDAMPTIRPASEWTKCADCSRIVKAEPRTLADLALHRVPSATRIIGGAYTGPPVSRTPRVAVTSCPTRERQLLAMLANGPVPLAAPVTGVQAALEAAPPSQAWIAQTVRDYMRNHRDKAAHTRNPTAPRPSVPQTVSASNEAILAARDMDRASRRRDMQSAAAAMSDK